jgi:Protein of unknown function (DUF2441)
VWTEGVIVEQVINAKLDHVTVAAPYKTALTAGQVLQVGVAHNPFFGFYESAVAFPVTDHVTGGTIQVKAVDWLRRVKAGTITTTPQTLATIDEDVTMHYVILSRELMMEEIRAREFVDAPSRQTCIYASENLAEAKKWNATLGGAGSVCELTCTGTIHVADSRLLLTDSEPLSVTRDRARQYWRGDISSNPYMETLFVGDVTVTGFGF